MTPKAVIFDCDGVVVDSEPMLFELLAADLAQHGLPMTLETLHHTFLGMTLQGLHEKANAMGANLPADWCDDFYTRLYAQLSLGTPLMPGILAVLDALDAAGIPFATFNLIRKILYQQKIKNHVKSRRFFNES